MSINIWVVRALVLITACLCAGCGESGTSRSTAERPKLPSELRAVALALNDYGGPEQAGILVAREDGAFEDVGLEVFPGNPAVATDQISYVLGGFSDLGISHLPQVVIARANGKPIVAVGSLVSHPTAALIWLPNAGIEKIGDLEGKTIGILGLPFQEAFLKKVLNDAGLGLADVRLRSVLYDAVPELASGRVDAILADSAGVQGAELRALGLSPVIVPLRDLGFPGYDELVVFASRTNLADRPRLIRDFMAASSVGTAAAIRNPQLAVKAVENGPNLDPAATSQGIEAGVDATLALLSESGYMDPHRAGRLIAWMHREGMIRRSPPVSSVLTNAYLSQP